MPACHHNAPRVQRNLALLYSLLLPCVTWAGPGPNSTSKPGQSFAWSEIGAKAGADYNGDGLAVLATPDGARLRCVFQRLEGEATSEGLWLASTLTNTVKDRFRVLAVSLGRDLAETPLPKTGTVYVDGQTVRFRRPQLVEEYSVSLDGVRQDFVVQRRPQGAGRLRVGLEVTGARVQPTPAGAGLVLGNSGRKIAYSRLRVTDATGKELPAQLEIQPAPEGVLAVLVNDLDAVYPIRIDPTFSDENWLSISSFPGANNTVYAAVVDDSGNLYIGGGFTIAGGVVANRIAKWDGNSWSALGSGMNDSVSALAVSGTNLYAGGYFTNAGGISANYVARWNGSSWSALGSGMNNIVTALAVSGTNLYVGGQFSSAGGLSATNVAQWNGNSWSGLSSGMNNGVTALAVSGTNLYAGGGFTTTGGVSATNVAQWNGSSWRALGSGMNGIVLALAVSGTNLYAGGGFTAAGGLSATNVAQWNGSSWSALGSGVNNAVTALAVSGTNLYAGGGFTAAGGLSANYVARWNGSSWSVLGSGMNSTVYALAVSGTNLYAGGGFTAAGGLPATRVAQWNGSGWSALGSGMDNAVTALAVSGTDLYAGGYFTTAGDVSVNYVARWNGSSWSALGSGMNGGVYALVVSGTNLYAGGGFTTAGGLSANRVAEWNGSSWSALGSGLNSTVYALAVSGTNLYAGGGFTTAGGLSANRVAEWNGSSWSPLGSGMNNVVSALAVSGTDLDAGGQFTTAGGLSATNVARWNGSSWSALGSGMNGTVTALAVSGTNLYAGGDFTTAGGFLANRVAQWNGNSWLALGSGMNGTVYALTASGTNLYAGGQFTTAGGLSANHVAQWNGSRWSALGSGMNNTINALAVSGSDLYAGGQFTLAGGKVSAYAAKAALSSAPTDINLSSTSVLENQPSGTMVGSFSAADADSGDTQNFSLVAGAGSADNGSFTISNGTNLLTAASFDYATRSSYSIRVRATDSGGLTSEKVFAITVLRDLSLLGNSSTNAARSAKSIMFSRGAIGSGLYWIDPDGAGPNPPFQAYCDMATDGGGWTLVLNSVAGSEAPTTELTNNLGTAGLTTGHVIAARNLAVNAELRHEIIQGSRIFHAGYIGGYYLNFTTPSDPSFRFFPGHNDLSFLNNSFSKPFAASPYGVNWYWGGSQTATPVNLNDAVNGPKNELQAPVDRYSIWVRERNTPPVLTSQPASRTNVAGTTASFSVTATAFGGGTLNYQWRKAGAPLSNSGDVSGASSATLLLAGVQATDAAAYDVVVTNSYGSVTSTVATLTVWTPPVITMGVTPVLQRVPLYGDAVFQPSVTGTAPFSYQWRKNGSDLPDATSSSLALTNLQFSDTGVYALRVTNVAGNAVGPEFTLTVTAPQAGDLDLSLDGRSTISGTVAAVAIQPDGKFVIGGTFTNVNGVARNRLARLNPDGSLDLSFLNGLTGANGTVRSLALQSDGKVVLAGEFSAVDAVARGGIARLNADGTLDTSFQNGMAGADDDVYSVALQSDGKVVIGGKFLHVNGTSRGCVARLTANGSLDTGFLNGLAGADNTVASVAMQTDGKVVIGGAFGTVNGVTRNSIARLNSTGSLDTGFQNGLAGANQYVYCVALQADGKLLLGGDFTTLNGTTRPRLARLNTNGTLDTGFGTAAGANGIVWTLSQLSDGTVLAGGEFTTVNGTTRNRFARLTTSGGIDSSFQNGMSGANNTVYTAAAEPDGKLVIGGSFKTVNGATAEGFARLWNALQAPPALTLQPQSGLTKVGAASFTFHVEASGGPILSYQWRKEGQPLTDGPQLSGATNQDLVLLNLQLSDAGDYDVVITNVYGAVTSSVAVLSVFEPLAITAQPQSRTNLVGTTAMFNVTVTGEPPIGYQWRKDGMNLNHETDATLTLLSVVSGDAGAYDVVVTNGYGSVTSAVATLTVVTPPAITTQPQSRTNLVGTTATFSVSATGTPPLAYQWRRAGTNLADALNISGASTSALNLANVQLSDASGYDIVVTNISGAVTSALAMLTVVTDLELLTNGGFETPVIAANSLAWGVVPDGWVALGTQASALVNGIAFAGAQWGPPQEGQQFLNLGDEPTFRIGQAFVSGGGAHQLTWYDNTANSPSAGPAPYEVGILDSSSNLVFSANFDAGHNGVWQARSAALNLAGGTHMLVFTARGSYGGWDTVLDQVSLRATPPSAPLWISIGLPLIGSAHIDLSFSGSSNSIWTVERSSDVQGPWTSIGSLTIGPNGVGVLQDTNPPSVAGFYRARQP